MDIQPTTNIEPLYWINFALVIVVSAGGWFIKRVVSSLDDSAKMGAAELGELRKEMEDLRVKVAILLDRDRNRRLTDYQQET